MIKITEQLCTQTMISEDRLRLQSYTIKIDGSQFRQLMELQRAAISEAQFQDLMPEDYPKITDLIAAALSRGISAMYKER